MGKVVLANLKKVDFQTTKSNIKLVESIDQVTEHDKTYLMDVNRVANANLEKHTIYAPSTFINKLQTDRLNLYFDLENYPFFQQAKEMIKNNTKGVFRLRRLVDEKENELLIVSDLYVLCSVFGEPEDIYVKHTKKDVTPNHVIITVNYGAGTMAHLDYTFTSEEFIELEWSGVQKIIEFNSKDTNPFETKAYTSMSLAYNLDSIIHRSYEVNKDLVEKLEQIKRAINGGDKL
ncbi:hypothetical protein QNH47_19275 [Virgibacillus halodenitrificans]|uniref:hypothetical protein n=1 Tax=Virgibacillus halodenitrificans TaxID=1482 RepID=UPI0024BF7DAB|nr:hypothetical protein [Virgibacillus halodenitrificans]WHX26246.1 hypothetical protein QNH47_19275 [Virgibacillus halodenitrificans]